MMKRVSMWALRVALIGLLVLPWMAEAAIIVGPGEADGISPAFTVDTEGAQRETFLLLNPANRRNLVLGWNERSAGRNSGQGFAPSFDYGANWGASGEISDGGTAHSDPALCASATGGPLGTIVFTYIHNNFSGCRARRSFDGGVTFPGPAVMVQADTFVLAGNNGIDKNWTATDLEPTSPGFDTMYMNVTDFGGTTANPNEDAIVLSASVDQGATWPVTTVKLDTAGDAPTIVQGSNVDVYGSTGATAHVWWEGTGASPAPFDIQFTTRTMNGGAVIAGPFSVPAGGVPALGALTPIPTTGDFYGDINSGSAGADFRVNSFPYVAVDTNPASPFFRSVYVLSTNSTAAAAGGGTDPDVMLWRGGPGAAPTALVGPAVRNGIPILNDDGGTADQVFPSITVARDGTVEVFWLDTRNDPGGSPRARFDIYYTCSVDGGITWAANTRITPTTFTHAGNTFIGDYDDSVTNRSTAPLGGGHTWRSYTVRNAGGAGTDPTVQAVNNTGPAAVLSGPTNLDCGSAAVAQVFDASGTVDVDDDPITYTWTVTAANPVAGFPFATNTGNTPTLNIVLPFSPLSGNTYTTTVTATDFFGGSSTAQVVTVVSDTTAPVINSALARTMLWPATYGLLPVGFTYSATDDCDPAPATVVSVYSNEPNGAAPYTPDAVAGGPVASLTIRAERAYPGPGRFYVVRYSAIDGSGNTAWRCHSTIVPLLPITSHILALRAAASTAEAACQASPVDVAPPGAPNTIIFSAALP